MLIDFFGLFSVELIYLVVGMMAITLISVVIAILSLCKTSSMRKKYQSFMKNSDGENIEKLIKDNLNDISELKSATHKNTKAVTDIYDKIQYAFQKIGLIKYDAFHEMGGKLSFALCMLDKFDNGFVMNVMHSNTGCYAYTKEIVNGKSYIELGTEEQKALDQALAGRRGDVSLSKKINDMLEPDDVEQDRVEE